MQQRLPENLYSSAKTVHDLVDQAINAGDRETAEAHLSIDACHGTLSSKWLIDHSVQSWREGRALFSANDHLRIEGSDLASCHILWNGERWDIYECSGVTGTSGLKALFPSDCYNLEDQRNCCL